MKNNNIDFKKIKKNKKNKLIFFLIITVILLLADQITKLNFSNYFFNNNNQPIVINSFFNLHLVFNTGISFGLFSGFKYSAYFFLVTSCVITFYLIYFLYHEQRKNYILPLTLIISGAIGNIIDRILYHAVVDFIQLHYHNYFWPTFNLADSYIFIGVLTLLILDFKNFIKEKKR